VLNIRKVLYNIEYVLGALGGRQLEAASICDLIGDLLLPVYLVFCHVVFPLIAVIYDILLPSIQYQLSIVLLISRPVTYYLLQPAMGLPAQALERTKLYRRTAHLRRTHRAHGTH